MAISLKNIVTLFCLFLIPYAGYSQSSNSYNLNINTGLPSNHIYSMIKDRHGYLWMGTENGVVKYNGYDLKTFDLSYGMANNDIWTLFEDKKGKIWLSTISYQMGYLYNDKYKKVFINTKEKRIYPTKMFENDDGIFFINHVEPQKGIELFNLKNDTLYVDLINTPGISTFLNFKKEIYGVKDNYIYKINPKDPMNPQKICMNTNHDLKPELSVIYYSFFNNNVITYNEKEAVSVNIYDTSLRRVLFHGDVNESIYNFCSYSDILCICTNKYIYKVNKKMQIESISSIEEMIPGKKEGQLNVTYYIEDNFWGKCLATSTQGLYLNYRRTNFKALNFDLQNYIYKGSSGLKNYWWNKTKKTLAIINAENKVNYLNIKNTYTIGTIIPYNSKSALISALSNFYLLNVEKNSIETQFPFKQIDSTLYTYDMASDIILIDTSLFYAITKGGVFCKLIKKNNNLIYNIIEAHSYKGISFDSSNHYIWLYDNQKIVAYREEKKIFTADDTILNTLGIKKIEKILIDPHYGNIFIKDIDKIFLFNFKTFSFTEIFKNFRLQKALCFLQNNTFIITGKFGVSFCKILGNGSMSEPIIYRNIKDLSYSYVSDAQTTANSVLLNTDKGMYSVSIPSDSELYANKINFSIIPYKLVTNYHDSVIDIKNGDTIFINQKDRKLIFDIINPLGNGAIKYSYLLTGINDKWQLLDAHELYLPNLKPDKHYTLSLIANDDVWRSEIKNIHLYIVPYWWQTANGKRMVYLSAFILAVLIILLIAYITKRIVTKKEAEKNLQLEVKNLHLALELKSIHAQINPHFIFNTLSTGLFFIKKGKMKDAYQHISAFSDLLRAYIKSSREKYITIADEIVNLRNYIELQQSRFENKFDYDIAFADGMAIDKIKIPSLLLQPLVENAITHGLFHKEGKGNLKIEFREVKENKEVICIIDDDGIGREQSKLYDRGSSIKTASYGNDLIKELINVFNNYEQTNIEIEYVDKIFPLTGTTVILTMKNPPHEK